MEIKKKIGDLVRRARLDDCKEYKEVADVFNLNPEVYLRYERGEHKLTVEMMLKLNTFYGYNIFEELFRGN